MFHVVFTIYMMLVAGIGPGLCCCVFKSSKHLANAEPETAAPCCCPHTNEPRDDKPSAPTESSCPCQQHQKQPGIVIEPNLLLFGSTSFSWLDGFLSAWVHPELFRILPEMTVGDRLVQHHAQGCLRAPFVLRC